MKDNLVISEKFYSLQGEGQTMGIPAVFVRLAGCNLLCEGDGWICDSIEVWQKGVKTSFENVLEPEYVKRLREGAHLIFTGGEPMLHQKNIIKYIQYFISEYGFWPIIEIETNGTIMPDFKLIPYIKYWNCSPKLKSSGETHEKRFKPLVLDCIGQCIGSIFKFVISSENDVLDVLSEYGNILDMKKVVLMPAGDDQEKLNSIRSMVMEQCKNLGLRYCDRLHIVGWNKKTGV